MSTDRPPFFGSLPTRGLWTAVGLSRAQFVAIIGVSVLAFVFIDGPLWERLDGNHFRRITLSYLAIPALIAAVQMRAGKLEAGALFGATIIIAVIKLLLTALLVLVLSF